MVLGLLLSGNAYAETATVCTPSGPCYTGNVDSYGNVTIKNLEDGSYYSGNVNQDGSVDVYSNQTGKSLHGQKN